MSTQTQAPHKVTLTVTHFHTSLDSDGLCPGHSEPFEGAHVEDEYEIEHPPDCGPKHPKWLDGIPAVPGVNVPYRCRLEEQLDQFFTDDEPPRRSGIYRVHLAVEYAGHRFNNEVDAIYAMWEPWADEAEEAATGAGPPPR